MNKEFILRGDTIDLFKLLKASGLCESGADAKLVIENRLVHVDGVIETRKACTIRPGQIVTYHGQSLVVRARSMRPSS